MSMLHLAAEGLTNKTLWYPTLQGILVVVAAVGLFCGSIYVLLGTNLGARLGFLVAWTGLFGFLVLLSGLWMTTTSPLNTFKGTIPAWQVKQIVSSPAKATVPAVHDIVKGGTAVDPTEAANVKAAVDAALVTTVATPTAPLTPGVNKFAKFDIVTDYKIVNTYEIGGSKPNALLGQFTHKPKYAAVEFCAVKVPNLPFGVKPPPPECDPANSNKGFMILERNLGTLRQPPIFSFIAFLLLFGLGLLALHWWERDKLALEAEKKAAATPAVREPEPVGS